MRLIRTIILLYALTAILPLGAQQRFIPPMNEDDSTATVSLLTCAPGADVYSLEGHSGLRLHYGATDIVANWGIFDFNAPNFIYRFVKGETDYSIGIIPTEYFLLQYNLEHRRVTEQTLNLTPGQIRKVIQAVDINMYPENRVYRYNYVLDNCATRPLQIVEQAIGDSIRLTQSVAELEDTPTFRNVMRHFHRNYPWYQLGIDICLGSGIDGTITQRATMFAPELLKELAATAVIGGGPRKGQPFVSSTSVLVDFPPEGTVLGPTPRYLTPIAAFSLLLAVTILLTVYDRRRDALSRWFDFLLFLAAGIAGCIVAFLVFISTHEATSPNWLLLWMNPLCLAVPALVFCGRCRKLLGIYHCYNIVAVAAFYVIAATGIQSVNPALLIIAACVLIRSINSLLYVPSKN